jgi:ribonuclease T2
MPDEPDGYVLELAWAPVSRTRFVVGGFASQLRDGSVRESCGKPKKLPGNVVRLATPYMRTTADVQREWDAHGTCSSLDPGDYFTRMIQARVAVQLPVQLNSLEGDATASPEEIASYFAGANTTFPLKAFQPRCANGTFAGLRVCFDRSLSPRECHGELSVCGTNVRITSQPARP